LKRALKNKLVSLSHEKDSRLILALDFLRAMDQASPLMLLNLCRSLLRDLRNLVVGVKIGLPLLLSVGVEGVKYIIYDYGDSFYFIADFKLSDIPDVVDYALGKLKEIGFDGVIVQLFPMGYGGVVEKHRNRELGIYGVALMSHRNGKLFRENFDLLVEYSLGLNLDGIIVGATDLESIKRARERVGDKLLILSPGVGVQGAEEAAAIRAGADFEIVGRSITLSLKPKDVARRIVEAERRALKG